MVSLGLLYHLGAVIAGAFGVPPSSLLEQRFANLFTSYHDLVDQGYAYRYYAEPPPTPVIIATLHLDGGRDDLTVRLPSRSMSGPRMRHQRQLALANALFGDVREARRHGSGASGGGLARSFARHLCLVNPGCRSVTLHAQQHLIPDPERIREAMKGSGGKPVDLFAESFFTTPEWIGDFPCDES